jgi:hypothetical protein
MVSVTVVEIFCNKNECVMVFVLYVCFCFFFLSVTVLCTYLCVMSRLTWECPIFLLSVPSCGFIYTNSCFMLWLVCYIGHMMYKGGERESWFLLGVVVESVFGVSYFYSDGHVFFYEDKCEVMYIWKGIIRLLNLYMWKRLNVFSGCAFFSVCRTSNVWTIVSYVSEP